MLVLLTLYIIHPLSAFVNRFLENFQKIFFNTKKPPKIGGSTYSLGDCFGYFVRTVLQVELAVGIVVEEE